MAEFLDVEAFAAMYQPLTAAEKLVAAPLLTVVSDWIRDKKPNIADDDPAAKIVTFEVTREALIYGEFGPVSSFTKTVAHRTKQAAIDREAVEKFIARRHYRMLGIAVQAKARGHFPKGDY
ncbi:hypothetical protein [Mycobacteroides immunogenum]|uniref:Uncharacterized protein n=1 Tax=Mycobacteroides immunogenum TaxID=83262 RepID=A0A7V8RXG2_9MYCO|nr:hypothetical protein [Mycobacteroides immunogenum]AMT72046.1 hypothetical protein ABG82_18875 [Mycobacteroides immunogenum]ANO05176.1 hypothetical protein BAB75_19145 [Mycobacteroides immunogenum]KIU40153.1 hypothetical protein TL11_12805 [Mycobacteroides immunogenum]KPG13652.1 hypothetical protein AN909_05080 [Mycobacteroides immunogenum]KPG14427.1 hypothetical protein AN908_07785 [Mycobacteroides immunogenum]